MKQFNTISKLLSTLISPEELKELLIINNKQIIQAFKLLVIIIGMVTIISLILVESKVDSLLNVFIGTTIVIVLGMAIFEKIEGRNRDFFVSITIIFIFLLFLFSRLI